MSMMRFGERYNSFPQNLNPANWFSAIITWIYLAVTPFAVKVYPATIGTDLKNVPDHTANQSKVAVAADFFAQQRYLFRAHVLTGGDLLKLRMEQFVRFWENVRSWQHGHPAGAV